MQIYVKHTSFQFSKHEKQRINANIQFIPVFKIRNANDQYKFM